MNENPVLRLLSLIAHVVSAPRAKKAYENQTALYTLISETFYLRVPFDRTRRDLY